ncbi:MAG TPA: hypothetical protein PK760_12650 [Flavobacteriales bacterium]|nr:hypothetical protein [Flavobacteriales bacterium]
MAIVRNIVAVIVGAFVCMFLNGWLLGKMMELVGTPEGFVPTDLASYGLLETKHYLSPFVAHAVPSFVGGLIAALIAANHKITFALVVGGLHFVGGVMAAFMIPAPAWFIVLDLVVAYLPMAWLGGKLVTRKA